MHRDCLGVLVDTVVFSKQNTWCLQVGEERGQAQVEGLAWAGDPLQEEGEFIKGREEILQASI